MSSMELYLPAHIHYPKKPNPVEKIERFKSLNQIKIFKENIMDRGQVKGNYSSNLKVITMNFE